MQYVALLRGINVGGNTMINMKDLKAVFEQSGFENVRTYINSGNVLFESEEKNQTTLMAQIEKFLTQKFHYNVRVLVLSHQQIKNVVKGVPQNWDTSKNYRFYVAFLFPPLTAEEAAKEIVLREGVDKLDLGSGVLYMTSLLSELTKSMFNKLAAKKVYQQMTIRNYNTTKKLLALMEKQ